MLPLTLLLLSLPAQASLADHLPRGVHLVETGALQAQAPRAPLLGTQASEQVSVLQLQADLQALRKARPSLAAPITLISIGGGMGLLGVTYLLAGLATGAFSLTTPFLVLGLAALGVGLPLAMIGAWMLYHRLGDRQRIEAETRNLSQQLRELQSAPQPNAPPPAPLPAPMVDTIAPRVLLASF